MATAFVTGGTGFVGHKLMQMLIAKGWSVRALHRTPKDAEELSALGAEPVLGDLSAVAALQKGTEGADSVFHVAALFKLWGSAAEFERANVEGTRNLLAAAEAGGVGRLVQIGAAGALMGDRGPMADVTEQTPLKEPIWSPYLASKARAQTLTLAANRPDGMRTSVIMPPLVWGRGMPMLGAVITGIEKGRFAWPGGGRQLISTAHVDNLCHCAILASDRAPGGRAYLVTDGQNRRMRNAMTDMLQTQGIKAPDRNVPVGIAWPVAALLETIWPILRMNDEPPLTRTMLRMMGYDFTISDQRARSELGYAPIISWDEGIAAMRLSDRA